MEGHLHLRILGTAAGGGFTQSNCACSQCTRARLEGQRTRPRSQAALAVSVTRKSWYLVNATPDVRFQIESHPELHPGPEVQA